MALFKNKLLLITVTSKHGMLCTAYTLSTNHNLGHLFVGMCSLLDRTLVIGAWIISVLGPVWIFPYLKGVDGPVDKGGGCNLMITEMWMWKVCQQLVSFHTVWNCETCGMPTTGFIYIRSDIVKRVVCQQPVSFTSDLILWNVWYANYWFHLHPIWYCETCVYANNWFHLHPIWYCETCGYVNNWFHLHPI